jgi:hypothetical protein
MLDKLTAQLRSHRLFLSPAGIFSIFFTGSIALRWGNSASRSDTLPGNGCRRHFKRVVGHFLSSFSLF